MLVSNRIMPLVVLIVLKLFATQLPTVDATLIPDKANCSSSQYQCPNGGCIQRDKICDSTDNCGDGADESDCQDMLSSAERNLFPHKCANGEIIPYMYLCDGRDKCEDGSDEKNCSDVAPCSLDKFECANGTCIKKHKQCDGLNDCEDWSDEIDCAGKCGRYASQCSNGNCVAQFYKCNCNDDCGDGSVEKNCTGLTFQCPSGKCILFSQLCNCEDDCGDGTDENNCDARTSQCPSGKCILASDLCNCRDDCDDGTDENDCDGRTFHCPSGKCILSSKLCDCKDDCGDGADEDNCTDKTFQCPNGLCLLSKYLNDGFDDCGDRADENYCSDEPLQIIKGTRNQNSSFCNNDGACEQFQCPNGKCIHNNSLGDCKDDCEDGSDEKNCRGLIKKLKKLGSFDDYEDDLDAYEDDVYHCANGECFDDIVADIAQCRGRPDCSDWSDEAECTGICHGFQCPSGRCLENRYLCNGIDDCGDKTDEKSCPDVDCEDYQFQCTSGECVHENLVCMSSLYCRDGSDEENCALSTNRVEVPFYEAYRFRFSGPFDNTFSNDQCDVIDYDSGMSLGQCLSWCESAREPACTAVNFNELEKNGSCVRRACPLPVPHPTRKEDDQTWKGYSRNQDCNWGGTYQTNNGHSVCTCVNGKQECKEKGCIHGSSRFQDDGCNYCICIKGEYSFCTERPCNSTDLPNPSKMCIEGSTQPSADGCNTCTCVNGSYACTEKLCRPTTGEDGEEP